MRLESFDSLSVGHLGIAKWCKFLSESASWIALYILLTTVVNAILWKQNLKITSTKRGWTVGPTNNVSLRETFDVVLAEASTCIGR